MEQPYQGRSQIKGGFNEIEIIIPSRKSARSIILVSILILIQFASCVYFYILKSVPLFNYIILADVLVSVIFFTVWLRVMLWAIAGAEIVKANQTEFSIEWKGSLFPYKKVYAIKSVKNLRIQEMNPYFNPNDLARSFMGRPNAFRFSFERPRKLFGIISFNYGLKSIIFGMSIDRSEAMYIATKLNAFIASTQRKTSY
ncbi:MAG TPA: hypothetical protein VNZ45_10600 [Bacteroidia bacterium]|jgi:hypothetical protein|nr:hypothetical protein [Bacteroidia bacterium]